MLRRASEDFSLNMGVGLVGGLSGKILASAPCAVGYGMDKMLIYMICSEEDWSVGVLLNKPDKIHKAANVLIEEGIEEQDLSSVLSSINAIGSSCAKGFYILESPVILCSDLEQCSLDRISIYFSMRQFLLEQHKRDIKPRNFIVSGGLVMWHTEHMEREIMAEDWLIVDATPEMVFASKCKDKWARVVRDVGIVNYGSFVNFCGQA
jgi:putative transcriptional regulator